MADHKRNEKITFGTPELNGKTATLPVLSEMEIRMAKAVEKVADKVRVTGLMALNEFNDGFWRVEELMKKL